MDNKVIGLSGFAGAGKDLFFAELQKADSRFVRFALADELKRELNPFLKQMYGIDIFTCSRELKNKVRPILVEHGKIRRIDSKGTHWTNILKNQIQAFCVAAPDAIVCVTDIRYDFYENDEVSWIQQDMGGTLVHISRYEEEELISIHGETVKRKKFQDAPNRDEAENDPKVKAKANYRVEWPTILNTDGSVNAELLQPYVTNFIKFLDGKN